MHIRTHRSLTLPVTLVLLGFSCPSLATNMSASIVLTEPSLEESELRFTLFRVGLTAEHLCAAGLPSTQIGGVVTRAAASLEANAEDLRASDSTIHSLREQTVAIDRRIRSGRAQEGDTAALASLQQQLAAELVARQSILNTIFTDAMVGVDLTIAGRLMTLTGNRDWPLPIWRRIIDRTEPQWVALRDAGRQVDQGDPTAQAEALVASVEAVPEVAGARARVTSLLGTFQGELELAIGNITRE